MRVCVTIVKDTNTAECRASTSSVPCATRALTECDVPATHGSCPHNPRCHNIAKGCHTPVHLEKCNTFFRALISIHGASPSGTGPWPGRARRGTGGQIIIGSQKTTRRYALFFVPLTRRDLPSTLSALSGQASDPPHGSGWIHRVRTHAESCFARH